MVDINMITAYFWACGIFQPKLHSALFDVDKRTKFVNEVNEVLLKYINNDINSKGHGQFADFALHIRNKILNDIGEIGKSYITNQEDEKVVINTALRLWSGCVETAKVIALETKDGPNTAEARQTAFFQIELFSKIDLVYAAGVESAPLFKKLHKEYYSFNGVPLDSAVRKYKNEYLI
jgi:hypothetical protein